MELKMSSVVVKGNIIYHLNAATVRTFSSSKQDKCFIDTTVETSYSLWAGCFHGSGVARRR